MRRWIKSLIEWVLWLRFRKGLMILSEETQFLMRRSGSDWPNGSPSNLVSHRGAGLAKRRPVYFQRQSAESRGFWL